MTWYLERVAEKIFLVKDEQQEEIHSLEAGKFGKVEVSLKSGVKVELGLIDFNIDGSSLGKEFDGVLSSRTAFLAKWKKLCTETQSGKNGMQHGRVTPSGIVDQVLKDKFLGTYDVHISNLTGPEDGRGTRDVDYGHVAKLETSFKTEDMGQVVLLVGMVLSAYLPKDLTNPDETKIETLGGNHTRLALQSLNEKGLLKNPIVKVNIYCALPRTEALALGYQHNAVLEDKKKPMTFVDKVKLMRECRPSTSMSPSDISEWKDTLCVIFRAENRRKLQVNLAHHLQMARLSDSLFKKILLANSVKQVTERFFKAMMRIDSDEAYHQCLDTLLENGHAAFNEKVSEYIEQGLVRSKKKGVTVSSINVNVSEENQSEAQSDKADDTIRLLQDRVTSLETEKENLQAELDRLKENSKRRREEFLENNVGGIKKWKVGDRVDARWKDKYFYAAEVQKVETVYHVVYVDDQKKGKVTESDLKELVSTAL